MGAEPARALGNVERAATQAASKLAFDNDGTPEFLGKTLLYQAAIFLRPGNLVPEALSVPNVAHHDGRLVRAGASPGKTTFPHVGLSQSTTTSRVERQSYVHPLDLDFERKIPMAQPVFSFHSPEAPAANPALQGFRQQEAPRASLGRALPREAGARHGFVLVKSAPDVTPAEVELLGVESVEVVVSWGENVLHVAHLTPPKNFSVGEGRACDYLIPYEKLGTDTCSLIQVENGAVDLLIPANARGHVEFPGKSPVSLDEVRASAAPDPLGGHRLRAVSGMRAEIAVGDVSFRVGLVNAGKPVAHGVGTGFDKVAASYFGGAFFAQAAIMAALAGFTPDLGLTDEEGLDQNRLFTMQQYLDASAERERQKEEQQTADGPSEREGGTGERAAGEEGQMGKPSSRESNKKWAAKGPQDNPDPHLARERALREATDFGIIGLLNTGAAGDPNAPTSPFGRDTTLGRDDGSAEGNMWGDEIGDAFGYAGLGLSGIGEGGGGKGIGVGLGQFDFGRGAGLGKGDGFGNGIGRLGARGHKTTSPSVRPAGQSIVSGRLPPEVIQRIVRQNFGRFRMCYEQGLTRNPNLEGRVEARFVIGRDGAVSNVMNGASDLPDAAVKGCVVSAFYGLSFPAPDGGVVSVTYPIMFTPGG